MEHKQQCANPRSKAIHAVRLSQVQVHVRVAPLDALFVLASKMHFSFKFQVYLPITVGSLKCLSFIDSEKNCCQPQWYDVNTNHGMISPAKETHPWQVLASLCPAENRLQRNISHSRHFYYCSLLQLTQRVTLCRQPDCTDTGKSGELVATDSKADGLWDGGGSSVGVRMSNKHDRASSKGKTLLTLMPHDLLVVTQLYIDDDVFQNIFCAI